MTPITQILDGQSYALYLLMRESLTASQMHSIELLISKAYITGQLQIISERLNVSPVAMTGQEASE